MRAFLKILFLFITLPALLVGFFVIGFIIGQEYVLSGSKIDAPKKSIFDRRIKAVAVGEDGTKYSIFPDGKWGAEGDGKLKVHPVFLNRYKQYSFYINTDEWRIFSLPEETELELALRHRKTDAFASFWSSPVPANIEFSKKVLEELADTGGAGKKVEDYKNGAMYVYESEYYGEPYIYFHKVHSSKKGSWGISIYMSQDLYLNNKHVVSDLVNSIEQTK